MANLLEVPDMNPWLDLAVKLTMLPITPMKELDAIAVFEKEKKTRLNVCWILERDFDDLPHLPPRGMPLMSIDLDKKIISTVVRFYSACILF